MIKIKSIELKNYCGYTNCFFDFSKSNGIKNFIVFYGPNGIGKTSVLNAIRLCSNSTSVFKGRERESDLYIRKLIYDENYLPSVDNVSSKKKNDMLITAKFLTNDGEKEVVIDNLGLLKNELPKEERELCFFADADNPHKSYSFSLEKAYEEKFIDFCQSVYGYKCELGGLVTVKGRQEEYGLYTDFIIKKGNVNVHYKSMSAGEKKIATLISDLLLRINTFGKDIVIVDNVEMHVYYKRHKKMVEKIQEIFPDKQIICTSHSSVVIESVSDDSKYDLEKYKPDYRLLETM